MMVMMMMMMMMMMMIVRRLASCRFHFFQGSQHSKVNGGHIRAQLPYIRTDVPVVLVFRALGYTNDKAILEHIVYDFSDTDMMEKFRYAL